MSSTATQDAATGQRRGRPRPQEVIQRDEKIFELIDGAGSAGITRGQLVERTGLEPTSVYLSLYRLRTSDRIVRDRSAGQHTWRRAT